MPTSRTSPAIWSPLRLPGSIRISRLQNAEFQLDRVASKWAADLKRDPAAVRKEIEQILQKNASAPWVGLAGEKFVNVLEVNLELHKQYGAPSS